MNVLGISLRNGYLQTWGFVSRIRRRMMWLGRSLQWLCGKITGHEISKTEWGYGGGGYADVWCRWCNQPGSIPLAEADKRFGDFRGLTWQVTGCDIRQQQWSPPLPSSQGEEK